MLSWIFTWWNGSTFGTALTLFKRGAVLVGRDGQGNRYYEEKKPSGPSGIRRRWVLYHGVSEASRVPPDWFGWLHHTFEEPPTTAPFSSRSWEKPHLPNMTGTPLAYRPPGSLARGDFKNVGEGYEAWTPENA
jgi:NADH:ubiquinone oxidoreductase subunit